jgi:aryl-alcohol dehydrogenase-like predicted oxidoreductase
VSWIFTSAVPEVNNAIHLTGPGYWGPPADPDHAIRLLRRARALGVNFIDTADAYGPDSSEQIIRQALHPYGDDVVISTVGERVGARRSGMRTPPTGFGRS